MDPRDDKFTANLLATVPMENAENTPKHMCITSKINKTAKPGMSRGWGGIHLSIKEDAIHHSHSEDLAVAFQVSVVYMLR